LIGEGRLSHRAEYIELTMTVHAECFATPMAASDAADAAVAQLLEKLNGKIDTSNPKDGVFSHGGFTQPFSRYGSAGRLVCEGTFQKQSTIVMKSSRVDRFAKDYAQIQRDVLSGSLRMPQNPNADGAATYAVLGVPEPQLYYETRERLEQRALADALDNARAKLEATRKAACGISSPSVLKFEENSVHGGRPIPYGRAEAGTVPEGAAVEFDAIWINKLLDVYFVVEPGPCS
jgi:hypothetical protein